MKTLKNDITFHYCPGCSHGIIHRLIADVVDELGIREQTIGVCPVGCAVFMYDYFNCDMVQAAHGRAPAVATGIKRVKPECTVFSYQGDGDLAAIGMAEIVHAAARSENITVIFANNTIYGMTNGQMAPTTLPGQITTTTPFGRDINTTGYPIRVSEMLATLDGAKYISRVAVNSPERIIKARNTIKKAFQIQQAKKGFSMVEILSTCSINWGVSPVDALKRVDEEMVKWYPLGEIKVAPEVM